MKKLLVILAAFTLTSPILAHYKPNPICYMATYRAGKNWDKKKPYKHQANMGAHINFIKDLYHQKRIAFGGSDNQRKFGLYCIQGKSKDEVKELLDRDPTIQARLQKYRINEITVTMQRPIKHEH